MELIRMAVLIILAAIVFSLGSALFALSKSEGDSSKLVRALTWRVGLSVALFALLMVAWKLGLVTPHGIGQMQGPVH
ncbi:MAG: twin transmembrane helix small protein [Steroidobacteraceae bacterium]